MKALTVKQPWAHLICAGIKDVENRTWKTNFRGKVLIHAGAKIEDDLFKRKIVSENGVEKIKAVVFDKTYDWFDFQTGAIIGSVEIVDCVQNHPSIWVEKTVIEQMECPKCGCTESEYFGDGEHKCDRCNHTWWENENKPIYNWLLANPVLFDEPILNMKGKLSFWESGIEVCHICGQPAEIICQDCDEYYCPDCGAKYNQFTQIDYDCCKLCGDSKNER